MDLPAYKASFQAAAGERWTEAIDFAALVARLRGCRVLWLGDVHHDRALHAAHAALLQRLAAAGFRLTLGLEALAAEDQERVDDFLAGRCTLPELRAAVRRRWPGSWLEDEAVDASHWRRLLQDAAAAGWPVTALEPAPRLPLPARDAAIAGSVRAAARPDRLLVVVVGQTHLLGEGDLVARTGLPAVAIGGEPPPALLAAPPPPAPPGGFLRAESGLLFLAERARPRRARKRLSRRPPCPGRA